MNERSSLKIIIDSFLLFIVAVVVMQSVLGFISINSSTIQTRFHLFQLNFPTFSTTTTTAPSQSDVIAAVNQASPAVVYVNGYKSVPNHIFQYNFYSRSLSLSGTSAQEITSGSGFFFNSSGFILTNKHVVSDTTATYKVNYNGKDFQAQIVYRDPTNDLAIVKIDGSNYPTIKLGDSSQLSMGQNVIAIGNALGQFTNMSSQGVVTSLSANIVVNGEGGASEKLKGLVRSSVKLYPGDSGGPLLNLDGQAVAINTATTVNGTSTGYSIPINTAKDTILKAGLKV